MKTLIFLSVLFITFSLISSLSYQYKPVISTDNEKIDSELAELKSSEDQEKVKVIVWLNDNKSTESLEKIGEIEHQYNCRSHGSSC